MAKWSSVSYLNGQNHAICNRSLTLKIICVFVVVFIRFVCAIGNVRTNDFDVNHHNQLITFFCVSCIYSLNVFLSAFLIYFEIFFVAVVGGRVYFGMNQRWKFIAHFTLISWRRMTEIAFHWFMCAFDQISDYGQDWFEFASLEPCFTDSLFLHRVAK